MTPTPEQLAIIEAAKSTKDSLLISALAGAAKTTTLELICRALPVQPILSLAFNKRIAEEMAKRLPGHVKSATLNSVGHGVWSGAVGKRLKVDKNKTGDILKGLIDELPKRDQKDVWENFSDYIRAIGAAKSQGYIPTVAPSHARRLVTDKGQFFQELEGEIDPSIIDAALVRSIKAAYDGTIDFDDQIYMPALFGGTFPRFPLVLVDEAQDLSPVNHALLERLVSSRIIAVGDRNQSIYAFRGADTYSMGHLKSTFSMTEMHLSISFRCPSEIVKLARKHAPTMQWWNEGGEVNYLDSWKSSEIPDEAAIICRNNAPLYSCAMALIKNGRGVRLVGSDIGPQLMRSLRKLGPATMKQSEVYDAIDRWRDDRLKKSRSKGSIEDKADCLRVFASFGRDLDAAIAYADHLFKSGGPIQLLSGHKAKGLEWDTVYHLDPHRIPSPWSEDLQQENNLDYVVTTRAKQQLNFVELEALQ